MHKERFAISVEHVYKGCKISGQRIQPAKFFYAILLILASQLPAEIDKQCLFIIKSTIKMLSQRTSPDSIKCWPEEAGDIR